MRLDAGPRARTSTEADTRVVVALVIIANRALRGRMLRAANT
jgi:hypothetical protein